MAKLRFTRKAVEDLTGIWNYTADTWSEAQADEYYGMLIDACRRVAENPIAAGRRYDEVAEGVFGVKAGRHILFYRSQDPDEVLIIRILHERMDLKARIAK